MGIPFATGARHQSAPTYHNKCKDEVRFCQFAALWVIYKPFPKRPFLLTPVSRRMTCEVWLVFPVEFPQLGSYINN